jgi:hypothetical protein
MRCKTFGITIAVIIVLLALGLSILYAGLPFFAQRFIEGRYHQILTEHNTTFAIGHVGLSHALVSDLQMGKDISADMVRLTYDLQGLDLPAARRLVISGLNIHALYDKNKGFVIDGIPPGIAGPASLEMQPKQGSAKKGTEEWAALLPQNIVLHNAAVTVHIQNKTIRIPCDLEMVVDKTQKTAACTAVFYPFGETISLTTRVDLGGKIKDLKLEAFGFALHHLAQFLPGYLAPVLSGAPDLIIEQVSHNNWQAALSGLYPEQTRGFGMERITARILKDHSQIIVLGQFTLLHPLLSDFDFTSRALLEMNQAGTKMVKFDLACESQPADLMVLEDKNLFASLEQPLVTLSLHGNNQVVEGNVSVRSSQALVRQNDKTFSVDQVSIKSDISGDMAAKILHFDLQSQLSGIHVENEQGEMDFRRVDTAGKMFWDLDKKVPGLPKVDLTTELLQGSVSIPSMGLSAQGISARMPLSFPDATGSGRFSVEDVVYDNRLHLGVTGNIHRTGSAAVDFDGIIQMPDAADLSFAFTGNAAMTQGPVIRIDAASERFRFSPFRFEKLLPEAVWSAEYDLDMTAKGSFLLENNQMKTGAELTIHGGTLALPDMDISATGIRGSLAVKDLADLASFPGQVLTIDEIKAADFVFSDADIRFTLEEEHHLVIENIRLKWCSGVVSTESVRFPSSDGSVSVTVYCDRIALDELLEQLGGFHSRGEGTLNGRIPVRFKDGDISFDNGFLFSTPGQGGRIIINNPGKLLAGIPVGSPEFVQLDLAAEALKDFEYTWAKLAFNTDKDTLTVNMELDGKPGRVLPFVYKKEVGAFVRVDAQSPGSHFQGITLDVNLHLPFNQVMQFGNKIQKLIN